MFSARIFECVNCGRVFEVSYDRPRPYECPECGCCEVKRSLRGILFDHSVMEERTTP